MDKDPRDDLKNFDPAGMYIGPVVVTPRDSYDSFPKREPKKTEPQPSN